MTSAINAGDIQIFLVGVTGNGWGGLTIDNFDSESDARACVQGAEYSVKPATDGGGTKTEAAQRLDRGIVRLHPGIFLTKPGRPAHPGKIQPAHPGRGVTDDRQSFDDGRVCPVLVDDDPRHRRFQVLASARRAPLASAREEAGKPSGAAVGEDRSSVVWGKSV